MIFFFMFFGVEYFLKLLETAVKDGGGFSKKLPLNNQHAQGKMSPQAFGKGNVVHDRSPKGANRWVQEQLRMLLCGGLGEGMR